MIKSIYQMALNQQNSFKMLNLRSHQLLTRLHPLLTTKPIEYNQLTFIIIRVQDWVRPGSKYSQQEHLSKLALAEEQGWFRHRTITICNNTGRSGGRKGQQSLTSLCLCLIRLLRIESMHSMNLNSQCYSLTSHKWTTSCSWLNTQCHWINIISIVLELLRHIMNQIPEVWFSTRKRRSSRADSLQKFD